MPSNSPFRFSCRHLLLFATVLLAVVPAIAHPMGNFSINHYAKITVNRMSVQILYLLDFAEIPTYQNVHEYGFAAKNDDPSVDAYLAKQADRLTSGLYVEDNGKRLPLVCTSRRAIFTEGAGGLPTMKIGLIFEAALPATTTVTSHHLTYSDDNYANHAGWKEVVAVSRPGVTLSSSTASGTDRSQELSNYPTDLLNSPPQQTTVALQFNLLPASSENQNGQPIHNPRIKHLEAASVTATASGTAIRRPKQTLVSEPTGTQHVSQPPVLNTPAQASALQLHANAQNTPRSRFTQLIATQEPLGFWFLLSAAFIAAGFGALHALEPGHGKTLVAAYLVGSHGKARHAVLLGFVVTAAHTAGVYLLGIIALYASRYIVPEQLYPWLGAISGLTVAGLGILIFLRHLTGENGEHSHLSGKPHSHWFSPRPKIASGGRLLRALASRNRFP